jgi:gamma-glutamylcyclotransferase (GGCT)/AIG2-like uncharacterized protein YtfP
MKRSKSRSYFAYGSNMDEAQMKHRCPRSRLAGNGRLNGYSLLINVQGVATVVPAEDRTVWGVLWELDAEDEKVLDRYEGVKGGAYRKEEVVVEHEPGERIQALVYVAAESRPGKPKDGYLGTIQRAAVARGFPTEYLEELRGWGKRGEE